jgi:hypothetical protein
MRLNERLDEIKECDKMGVQLRGDQMRDKMRTDESGERRDKLG